jgi:hypothetical protein
MITCQKRDQLQFLKKLCFDVIFDSHAKWHAYSEPQVPNPAYLLSMFDAEEARL